MQPLRSPSSCLAATPISASFLPPLRPGVTFMSMKSGELRSTMSSISTQENNQYALLDGLKGLAESGHFKAWLLDQFGVLHDGQRPYPGAVETLQMLASSGAKLIILSNSSKRSESTIQRMAKLGFDPSLFAGVITSGELTYQYLLRRKDPWFAALGERCIHMTWSERGSISLEGLSLEVVDKPESADFVLAHGTEALGKPDGSVERATLEELEVVLKCAAAQGLPMIVANPDHVTVEARALRVMPGTLGATYERFGGHVQYMGKPDGVIYKAAESLTEVEGSQTIAVGDSLFHDIQGAAAHGIESIFVAGGIHANDLGVDLYEAQPKQVALESLFQIQNIYPSYVIPMFTW